MKAIVQRAYGDVPEEILRYEDVPEPAVGPGDVLVRVEAAGVDRGTWHLMTGTPWLARAIGFGARRPRTPIPGRTLAGTVVAVGSGVAGPTQGDEVFGTALGTFAEFAVTRANRLARIPAALTAQAAATVPDSAVPALQAIRDMARVNEGDAVAVIGASGGVGSFAVQLAKAYGAHVTAVAGPAKQEFVASLGADLTLDYRRDEIINRPAVFDVVIDIGGNRPLHTLRRILSPRGRLVIVGGEGGSRLLGGISRNAVATMISPFTRQTLRAFVARSRTEDMATIAELMVEGRVRAPIDRAYSLGEASTALRALAEGRVMGKVVLVP